MGYIKAANRQGAATFTGVEVTGVDVQKGRIKSVETYASKINTPLVVNATGPWAGLIGRMAGVEIPITPLRRQMLTTTPLPKIPAEFPFVIDFAQSLHFHREGEGLLTGMSNPDEKPGFDQEIDPTWELVHLEAAAQLALQTAHHLGIGHQVKW
jgi:sarcosine oxidase subunit beta